MISLQQIRRFFVTMSLAVMLSTGLAFSFGTADSWAASAFTQIATNNPAEAITKNVQGKVQEAIDNIKSNSKTEIAGNTKQSKDKTLEEMNKSIVNPNYQPGRKTKQAATEDGEATEDIKAEASEAMESYSQR